MITIVTTHGRFTIEDGDHWARDDERDVHVYANPDPAEYEHLPQDGDTDPLATVEGARFVAAYKTDNAENTRDGFDRNPNTPDR